MNYEYSIGLNQKRWVVSSFIPHNSSFIIGYRSQAKTTFNTAGQNEGLTNFREISCLHRARCYRFGELVVYPVWGFRTDRPC